MTDLQIGMTPKQYIEKKTKGLASATPVGDAFVMSVKQFSTEDGTQQKPQLFAFDMEQLQQKRAELVQELTDLDVLIADLDALTLE